MLGAAGILPGGGGRQAPLLFDEALREKVFFGCQVLIPVSRTRGILRLLSRCSTFNKDFVQVNDNAHVALSFYGVGAFDFIQTIGKRKKNIPAYRGRRNANFDLNMGCQGLRRRCTTAIVNASTIRSARMWFAIAQTTIHRLNTPRMIARYRKLARGGLEVPLDPILCRRNLRILTRRGRRTATSHTGHAG